MRAARAALNLSQEDVSGFTGVDAHKIIASESGGGELDPQASERVRALLESCGIVFFERRQADPGIGPGLQWRDHTLDQGTRPENLNSTNDD
ncbi:DNA-binding protein [Rhizobium lemnae]|nr:DNA-binding protein [Rhizobium lemnae]MCJ8508430.1 DNA-binding protein [Rhizobium lemnae]